MGYEVFHGLFQVDERVLIPRPETEELMDDFGRKTQAQKLKVLDIGTGSGAISVSLKKEVASLWQVTASDLSVDALELAKENAKLNQVDISFTLMDVFENISGSFDIIVSNPPIFLKMIRTKLSQCLGCGPKMALFADEGLAIYRQIIEEADEYLAHKWKLYFEIGYKQEWI